MLRSLGILLVAAAAIMLPSMLDRMPAPFDDAVAVEVPPEAINLPYPVTFSGPYAKNTALQKATRLFKGIVNGSESVAVTPSGDLIMLDKFGFVHRARPTPAAEKYILQPPAYYIGPGRPLGFHMVGDDSLYVCDSLKGLLRLTFSTRKLEILSNAVTVEAADGSLSEEPLHYANDLDVASDGSVYFTSCTDKPVAKNKDGFYDTMQSYLYSSLRGAADGRLLRYDAESGVTSELFGGLRYANGVALSQDEDWVAVVETNNARIIRFWLKGPKRGTTDVLVAGLPGMPDGISRSKDGGFWVALIGPISFFSSKLGTFRVARQLLSHVIMMLLPFTAKWGAVVKLDAQGTPISALYDPDGTHVATVSAATEHSGRLFLGNLGGDFISFVDLNSTTE